MTLPAPTPSPTLLLRGLAGSVLVLLGGLVVATYPLTLAWGRLPVAPWLHGQMLGRMAGLVVVMAGLFTLATAWLALCVRGTREPEETVGLARGAAFLWSLPMLVAPPLFSRDGWSYAAQGVLAADGEVSPYDRGPSALVGPIHFGVDPMWLDTPAPYGPLPLMAGALASGLTESPGWLVLAHRVVALGGLALLAWAVPLLARWAGANSGLAAAITLVSPLTFANGVAGMHNDLLMAGLMAAALAAAVRHGWVAGAVVTGLAAAVKLPGGLVGIAVALVVAPAACDLATRLAALLRVGLVSLGTLVALSLGSGLGFGWLGALAVPADLETPLSATTLVGGWLDLVFDQVVPVEGDPLQDGLRLLGSLVALGIAAWVALTWPTGDRTAAVTAAAVVLGSAVVLGPVVHLWYLLWALPFAAAVPLRPVPMTWLVVVAAVVGLVAPLDSSLHGLYSVIVVGSMSAALAALALFVGRGARQRVRRITAPPLVQAGSTS